MQCFVLAITALLLTGCAGPVTVLNPRTGQTVTCGEPNWELNPWSQHDACVGTHLAEGWTIVR